MKKPREFKSPKHQNSTTKDWFTFVNDENKQLAIPIGPRFQANVPEWAGPPQRKYPHKTLNKSTSSKWLGTVIWSNKNPTPETEQDIIGRGRPHRCDCYTPGSILCVKRHISEKTARLEKDLGPAFKIWKFDEMGEAVAKLWKQSEQNKFAQIVKKNSNSNSNSEGNNFIKLALQCFPSKSRNTIGRYYFNVYLPRRISIKTRSGCTTIDTDDEEEEKTGPCSKGPRKRAQVDNGPTSKVAKVGYLTGKR